MQSIITCVVSFIIAAIGGRFLIPALRALHVGQSIREVGPTWHNSKQGTPVMGGLMFIGSALICILTALGGMRNGDYTYLIVYVFALIFGVIGFLDDFIKVRKKRNLGLTEIQKLLLQLVAAALYLVVLRKTGHLSSDLYIPFFNVNITIPWVLYLLLSIFIIVGTVNAVNLTDGVDGLSSSVTIPVMIFYAMEMGRHRRFAAGCGTGWRSAGLPDLQLPPGKGVYGRYGLPVPGRRRMRPCLCVGYAPDPDSRGDHLYC